MKIDHDARIARDLGDKLFDLLYDLIRENSNGYDISSIQFDPVMDGILDMMIESAALQCVNRANVLPPDASIEYYQGYKDATAKCIKAIRKLKV